MIKKEPSKNLDDCLEVDLNRPEPEKEPEQTGNEQCSVENMLNDSQSVNTASHLTSESGILE